MPHVQVVIVVTDDGDLGRGKARRGTEAEHHAGLRLLAMTTVIAGDEIDIGQDAEAFGGNPDRAFVVAGGDAETQTLAMQPREKRRQFGDRYGELSGVGEAVVDLRHQNIKREGRTGFNHAFGNLDGVARRKQAVRHDVARDRIHAAGGKQAVGQGCVAIGGHVRHLAVDGPPTRVEIEQRSVLVEEDAGNPGLLRHGNDPG